MEQNEPVNPTRNLNRPLLRPPRRAGWRNQQGRQDMSMLCHLLGQLTSFMGRVHLADQEDQSPFVENRVKKP
jgi:hypothetical protein